MLYPDKSLHNRPYMLSGTAVALYRFHGTEKRDMIYAEENIKHHISAYLNR